MDTYGIEWDPSYDPIDTSWVDDSFWDDFDMDDYENTFDQDTFDVDSMDRDNLYNDDPASDQQNMNAGSDDTIAHDTNIDESDTRNWDM